MLEVNILVEDEKLLLEYVYLCSIGKCGIMIEVGVQFQGVLCVDVYDLIEWMVLVIFDFVNVYNSNLVLELLFCDVFCFIENIIFLCSEDGERLVMIYFVL